MKLSTSSKLSFHCSIKVINLSEILTWLERLGKAFALVFIMLLVIAAVFLAKNEEGYANLLAEYAYYSLVISVIIMIVVIAKEGDKDEKS